MSITRDLRESMLRKSRASVWRAISASVPASSTPVGPAPITAKVRQASRCAGVLGGFGLFESGQDARADRECVVEILEAGRVPLPVVATEVGVRGAAGHQKIVVGDLVRTHGHARATVSIVVTSPMKTVTFF